MLAVSDIIYVQRSAESVTDNGRCCDQSPLLCIVAFLQATTTITTILLRSQKNAVLLANSCEKYALCLHHVLVHSILQSPLDSFSLIHFICLLYCIETVNYNQMKSILLLKLLGAINVQPSFHYLTLDSQFLCGGAA